MLATYQCRVNQKFCNENIDETEWKKGMNLLQMHIANTVAKKWQYIIYTLYTISDYYTIQVIYYVIIKTIGWKTM